MVTKYIYSNNIPNQLINIIGLQEIVKNGEVIYVM